MCNKCNDYTGSGDAATVTAAIVGAAGRFWCLSPELRRDRKGVQSPTISHEHLHMRTLIFTRVTSMTMHIWMQSTEYKAVSYPHSTGERTCAFVHVRYSFRSSAFGIGWIREQRKKYGEVLKVLAFHELKPEWTYPVKHLPQHQWRCSSFRHVSVCEQASLHEQSAKVSSFE